MEDSTFLMLEENGFVGDRFLIHFEKEQDGSHFKIKTKVEINKNGTLPESLVIIEFDDGASDLRYGLSAGTIVFHINDFDLEMKVSKILESISILEQICFYVILETKDCFTRSFVDKSSKENVKFHSSYQDVLHLGDFDPIIYCEKLYA